MLWQFERIELFQLDKLLLGGLRVDLSTAAYLTTPLFLLVVIGHCSSVLKPWLTKLQTLYMVIITTLVVLFEIATPTFILQYDVRPNRLFVEYLAYPKEVFSMLISGHLISLLLATVFCSAAAIMAYRLCSKINGDTPNSSKLGGGISLLLTFMVILLCARGTIGHRPLNPSLVFFSQDSLVNSLVLNSPYSVAFAIKNMGNEKSAASLYGDLPTAQIIDVVRKASYRENFVSDELPTLAHNQPYNSIKGKNLVIILEESLGARFVGSLGGNGITPEIDKLYQQGWGFNNLYATGTRSVRGIEAVISGFLPSPSRSVVKLSKSQQQFFTLADVLANEGYTTQFIYGGESHFDNMKSFFLGNGFEDIVDSHDIANPKFVASWGVSDEDLFTQADSELTELNNAGKPFFSLIFTSSNHDPFDIPTDNVSLPQGYDSSTYKRDLAIKYADYALGQFITKAKQQDYWQNTVFLIVADHDVRVFGSEPVPIKSFHVPAVILNTDFDQKQDNRLVSQIDLPVTLLSLLGVNSPTPMTGLDLTKEYPVERAIMQYYDNYAYLENGQAVILTPGQPESYWRYNLQDKSQSQRPAIAADVLLKNKALAHVLFANLAYKQQLYRLETK
ncbi:LTA synthase family protein [Alteromonadaceae bacterium BrNp21-10]|nr:LTA synthase family protein [Alteromonadaceae bacterium BrNp21-10]